MPINIDSVYQTVQALANKEQRGYLTPQEFNLFATNAQKDIFEQYLYDLDAVRLSGPVKRELGDSLHHILFKIQNTDGVSISKQPTVFDGLTGNLLISKQHFTGKLLGGFKNGAGTLIKLENEGEVQDMMASKWHSSGFGEIVYVETGYNSIRAYTRKQGSNTIELITDGTMITYERIDGYPGLAYWGYMIINEKPIFNPDASKHFALHESEQPDLVAKILKLAGISMEDQELYQAGQAEESLNTQQQNK